MQLAHFPLRRFWLVLFTVTLSLGQMDALAAPPWKDDGENPGKEKSNKTPVIEGTASSTAEVDQHYSFQATASDRDGDALKFSISNKPSWAAFDTARGYLSGFPTDADAGRTTKNIVVSVSDGFSTASLSPFNISVGDAPAESNTPPTISGSPPGEVMATETYAFRPSASDPDGDTLVFRVSNKPAWAGFNSDTGRLSGTPGDADVGLYENISISVTDGTATASTNSFSVAVVQTTTGTATLSWLAPEMNSDGSALTDLSGYRIYYGNAPGQYDHELEISDAATMSAVIDNLTTGSWYFAATALNSQGLESDLSNEVQKTVQ